MSKYEEGRATDKTVLLPMTEEEAGTIHSLLFWAIGELMEDHRVDMLISVKARLRKLIPPPGPTISRIG